MTEEEGLFKADAVNEEEEPTRCRLQNKHPTSGTRALHFVSLYICIYFIPRLSQLLNKPNRPC